MTTTYDPFNPAYFDEGDLRSELTRVYDLCHGCRLCFKFCTAFPTLFDLIDRFEDQDAGRLTPAEQDRVVDECFGCKLCYVNCPYVPGRSEWNLDFPRLMLRAEQVRTRNGERSVRERLTTQALARTDLAGRTNSALAPLVNPVIAARNGPGRRLLEKVVGIAADRLLPPYARERFSTWFRRRPVRAIPTDRRQGDVALFPTCIVEYQDPAIGRDLVRVLEHNRVACSLPEGQRCCGAPWLHSGDVEHFVRQASDNIAVLADAVRAGQEIVVPQPTCSYVLKHDYVDYVGGDDARLVAEHTWDAAEFLWRRVQLGEGTELDTDFTGEVPTSVTYHAPCHLRAQNIGYASRDLVALTGAEVTVVAECSGIDGTWGYRAANHDLSRQVARKLADAVEDAGTDAVVGDCRLANGGIEQETGARPIHPVQFLARAYGFDGEEPPCPS